MANFRICKGRVVIRVLQQHGFALFRKTGGSHQVLGREGWPLNISVPVHTRDLGIGIPRQIIADADLTVDEFNASI